MGLYERYLLPRLIHLACGMEPIMEQRRLIVPRASGEVLEIGAGSGLNFASYDRQRVHRLWALEPSAEMVELARRKGRIDGLRCDFVEAGAEEIPLADASVDTVVLTYTLCTIPRPEPALLEMRRVLRPGGRLLFCEHGRAPDVGVRRWQRRIEPLWKRLAGGCHLTRDAPQLLREAGFDLAELEHGYLPGLRAMTFNTWGEARPAVA
ncbi:MAG: class I SAM-dependent methyltransferase [Acidobacteria bacterium]|nr:MAG: class I SAM-dependent methyltransferase [Acidobacteriota bacterium]REK07942.1 MAG: class I SAM-dependent methyltransferase [Acidobacteriota bacterium]